MTVDRLVRFSVLGAVEARYGGEPVLVPRPRQRGVLAYLLIHANRYVTAENLGEAVWGGAAPATARTQIHADIHAIRRALHGAGAPNPLRTWHLGYRLDIAPGQLDLDEFTTLVASARGAARRGQSGPAEAALSQALALWRGPALGGIRGAYLDVTRAGLEDRRLAALEDWADAALRLGHADEVTTELTAVRPHHPLRERLTGLLMLALGRDGRAAEALSLSRALRRELVRQHGLDPGAWFVAVERGILTGTAGADASPTAGPATVAAQPADNRGRLPLLA